MAGSGAHGPPGSPAASRKCSTRSPAPRPAPLLADPRRPANNARFVYLDPASQDFFLDWERAADDIAAMLRLEAGRNPHDKQLIELIGEWNSTGR